MMRRPSISVWIGTTRLCCSSSKFSSSVDCNAQRAPLIQSILFSVRRKLRALRGILSGAFGRGCDTHAGLEFVENGDGDVEIPAHGAVREDVVRVLVLLLDAVQDGRQLNLLAHSARLEEVCKQQSSGNTGTVTLVLSCRRGGAGHCPTLPDFLNTDSRVQQTSCVIYDSLSPCNHCSVSGYLTSTQPSPRETVAAVLTSVRFQFGREAKCEWPQVHESLSEDDCVDAGEALSVPHPVLDAALQHKTRCAISQFHGH